MTEQQSLFPDDPTPCKYPTVAPRSGYKYGCRCGRCSSGQAEWRRDECVELGCHEPRAAVQGARRCAFHLEVRKLLNEERNRERRRVHENDKWIDIPCLVCAEPVRTYRSRQTFVPLCDRHNTYRKAIGRMRRHGAPAELIAHVMQAAERGALTCAACGLPVHVDRFHVDHDHEHCPGEVGCADCVRGVLHPACNLAVGHLERLRRTGVPIMPLLEYSGLIPADPFRSTGRRRPDALCCDLCGKARSGPEQPG